MKEEELHCTMWRACFGRRRNERIQRRVTEYLVPVHLYFL